MQSYDDRNKVVQSDILNDVLTDQQVKELNARLNRKEGRQAGTPIPQQIRELVQQAEKKGAVRHVIAKMPNHGQEVEIGGLKFTVSYVNNRRGDVHLKLQGVTEEAIGPVTEEASEEA